VFVFNCKENVGFVYRPKQLSVKVLEWLESQKLSTAFPIQSAYLMFC